MKNQIIKGLSFAEYLKIDAVNFSSLKNCKISMAEYIEKLDTGIDKTTSMSIGHGLHSKILEPITFDAQYIEYTSRRAGKTWNDFEEEHSDKTIFNTTEMTKINNMADSLRSNPQTRYAFNNGDPELTIIWTDVETGILCKARLDYVTDKKIIDLKTTKDVLCSDFSRAVANYSYYTQFAMYQEGYRVVTGKTLQFDCVAVENISPFRSAYYEMIDEVLVTGRKEFRNLMTALKHSIDTNSYPDPLHTEKQILELPRWHKYFGEPDDVGTFEEMEL